MIEDEIIKHIPEAVGIAKVAAASIPFTAIVKRMLGPAADELAEMWRDQVRLYRYGNQVKCIEKAERIAKEAGFTPQAVPPKILFPLLEGASLEENEDLHTMWAALLANAASDASKVVRPGFITLLRNMAPDEAALLAAWPAAEKSTAEFITQDRQRAESERVKAKKPQRQRYPNRAVLLVRKLKNDFILIPGEDESGKLARFDTCVQALEDASLLAGRELSGKGKTFLRACTPPKPKF